jgi:hypothetical protein
MASREQILAALPAFRNEMIRRQQSEMLSFSAEQTTEATRGAFAAFATPLTNIHATAAGIRCKDGIYHREDHVIKVFVYDKLTEAQLQGRGLGAEWNGAPIDVEILPIQRIRPAGVNTRAKKKRVKPALKGLASAQTTGVPEQRRRFAAIVAGVSISPLSASYVGTLGCFLKRKIVDKEELFVLSNNHVLANVNQLPIGTSIVQPGPEVPPFSTSPNDVFAALANFIPLVFPDGGSDATLNRFDAAIANVTDSPRCALGKVFGNLAYDPGTVAVPAAGTRVTKAGRTTGVTSGTITATGATPVQVNYGTQQMPRIAVFTDIITIVGDNGKPFSLPGDSGSVILEEGSGHPVALLFAGDGRTTSACDLGQLCQRLQAWPV